jgi:Uma2 family endonuclease
MSTASSLAVPSAPLAPAPRPIRVRIGDSVCIPADVIDLDSFCRWATSDQFPERGQFSYLSGTIWVDLSREELYSHNQVRAAFAGLSGDRVDRRKIGRWLGRGMLLRNSTADLSTEPDGIFVSYDALRSGRVQRIDDKDCLQLDGSPEMVLEVVSATSVGKDTVELRERYWRAEIAE